MSASTKPATLIPKTISVLDDLCLSLQESHQPVIDERHHGDGRAGCSYCDVLAAGRRVLRQWQRLQQPTTTT